MTRRIGAAGWQSGYAEDCKSFYVGSIPAPASILDQVLSPKLTLPTGEYKGHMCNSCVIASGFLGPLGLWKFRGCSLL